VKRASELSTTLFATRAQLAEKNGQSEALAAQLRKLKPVTQSQYVSSLVDALSHRRNQNQDDEPASSHFKLPQAEAPPLLMVKVYQDSIVLLFKVNAEIRGLNDLEAELNRQVKYLNASLADLESKEAEYAKLKRSVSQATLNADLYSKRAVEERVSAKLAEAKISSVKILQFAYTPLRSNFPGYPVIALAAAASGLVLSVLVTLTIEYLTSRAGKRLRHDLADVWSRDVIHAGSNDTVRP